MSEASGKADRNKERRKLLDVDGPVISFLTKTGELILLSLIWVIFSLPIITIGASTTALYYSVVKNIRKNRGYPVKEFYKSFKRSFKNATFVTIIGLLWGAALYRLTMIAVSLKSTQGSFLVRVYTIAAVVTVAVLIYVFPVISRFSISARESMGLAFVMAGRCIGYTIILLAGAGVTVYLCIFYIPLLAILIIPSFWTLLSSFLIEKALRMYMPEPGDGDTDKWFYK